MKKVVVKLDIHDDKNKQKAMKAVASLGGITSIEVNMRDNKMIVIGDIDPVLVVNKLRKQWDAHIDTVGPVKDEKKDDRKDNSNTGNKKGDDSDKKDDKKRDQEQQLAHLVAAYKAYNAPYPTQYYYHHSYEENPDACIIS